jgi:hypothetical protein
MEFRYRFIVGWLMAIILVVSAGCVFSEKTAIPNQGDDSSLFGLEEGVPSGPEYVTPEVALGPDGNVYLIWLSVEWRKSWDVFFIRSQDHGMTWSAPRSLKPDKGTVAGGLRLVTDEMGQVFVAWREWHPVKKARRSVLLRSKDGGANWDRPVALPASSRTLGYPYLLPTENGSVVAAWTNGPKDKRFLEMAEMALSADGALSFPSTPMKMSAVTQNSQFGLQKPRFSAAGEGNVYLVWEEARTLQDFLIYFNRSSDWGKTWGDQPVILNPDRAGVYNAQRPQVVTAPNGRIYVLWEQYVVSKHQPRPAEINYDLVLAFNRSDDYGKTWLSNPIRLNEERSSTILSSSPQLRADRHGNVYVIWVEGDFPETQQLYFVRSTDGGATWSLPMVRLDLTSPFKGRLFGPEIRNDGSGHIWVLWQELAPSPKGWQLLVNRSEDYGRSWLQRAIPITGPIQRGARFRGLSFEADRGGLYVVWEGGPGNAQQLFLNRSQDFGATWLPREQRLGDPRKGT